MLHDRGPNRGGSGLPAPKVLPSLPILPVSPVLPILPSLPVSPISPILPALLYRDSTGKRGAGVGAFLLAIVTAGALAHVGVRIKGLQVAYDLGSERRIATELEEQRRRLQIEIGMLKDPGRVVSIAREKLNMGPPTSDAIWRLGSGVALGRPALAAPTTPKVVARVGSAVGTGASRTSPAGTRRRN